MKILAIDTSAVCASVAVTENGKVLAESSVNTGLTHSRTLMPMIDGMLKNSEISLDEIDFFACSVGPGSFTGVRIGVAAIKGLCDGTGKKCMPVSTLEALAYNLIDRDCIAVSVMDARCQQVYCGIFRNENGQVTRLTQDDALKIDDLGHKLKEYEGDIIFVGDGAEICHKALGYKKAGAGSVFQRGSSVAFCADKNYGEDKLLTSSELMPLYLRLPQAERELKARKKVKQFTFKNLSYGEHERQVMDLYLPENKTGSAGLLLLIHGGSWISGDKECYSKTAEEVCNKYSVAAASVNYRYISPTVKMTDLIDDIESALLKIRQTGAENGMDIEKAVLGGHSAGGHLSMLYSYTRKNTAPVRPVAVLNYSGPTDFLDESYFTDECAMSQQEIENLMSLSLGKKATYEGMMENKDEVKAISPVYYVDENTVPTVINHGVKDVIVPYSNALILEKKLREFGVRYDMNTYSLSGHGLEADEENRKKAEELADRYIREYLL